MTETAVNTARDNAAALPVIKPRLESWPLDRLRPYEKNARTHSEAQVEQLAASMREFGFTNPILVADDAGILAGHGRLLAARKLGLEHVPVLVLDHLSEVQRRAYIIADNKLALNAGWEVSLLNAEILELTDLGFDIASLGCTNAELEMLAAGGWDSDIVSLSKHEENLDGIECKVVIRLDGSYRDEVIEAIRTYCEGHTIRVAIT